MGDYVRALAPAVGALMQEEVSRFQECAALLADFHAARAGRALPSEPPAPLNVVAGLLDEAEGRAGELEVTSPLLGERCASDSYAAGETCASDLYRDSPSSAARRLQVGEGSALREEDQAVLKRLAGARDAARPPSPPY